MIIIFVIAAIIATTIEVTRTRNSKTGFYVFFLCSLPSFNSLLILSFIFFISLVESCLACNHLLVWEPPHVFLMIFVQVPLAQVIVCQRCTSLSFDQRKILVSKTYVEM